MMKQLSKYSFNTHLFFLIGVILPFLSWLMKGRVYSPPMFEPLGDEQLSSELKGKEILVVGGLEGIGASLVRELHRRGSLVTATGADGDRTRYTPKGVEVIVGNASTMRGAQELGRQLGERQFDTVVFSGGFVPRPLLFTKGEGAEEDLETSYLSRFIVLQELINSRALMGRKRVYVLGYPGEDRMLSAYDDMWFSWNDYKQIPYYLNTVLFNDALVKEAARRYPGLAVFGINPGFLSSASASDVQWEKKNILSRMFGSIIEWFLTMGIKSTDAYVHNTLVQIIAAPGLDGKSGTYINDKLEDLPPKRWFSKLENRIQVWENSEKLITKALG